MSTERVVVVTGSRTWTNVAAIRDELMACEDDEIPKVLVQGGAGGVDSMAASIARQRKWRVVTDWQRLGKRAGPERDKKMMEQYAPKAYRILAFSKESSRGTENAIEHAKALSPDKLLIRRE